MERGTLVGERFRIGRHAGSGGMGSVYQAEDLVAGGVVAVKVMRALAPELSGRFAREAEALASLSHAGIVGFVGHGITVANEPFIAMEWLEGEDLAARLRRTPLTIAESVRLVGQAAEALGFAHARGFVHRDIKPENLFLVGEPARVKVLDFGIARVAGAARQTRTGAVIGSPGYMAPEQARGERAIDARADVFSLGCVLYTCLTGRAPFEADHLMAILAKILFEDAPPVSRHRSDVSGELEALVARMLARAPDGRPTDGRAVAQALAGLAASPTGTRAPAVTRAPALTGGEQRYLCVLLAGGPSVMARTMVAAEAPARAGELRALAARHGGTLDQLADGTVLAAFSAGAPMEVALRAARCALAARALLPDVPMVLSTGRGVHRGPLPVGEVVDTAARRLSSLGTAPGEVLIDEVTAALLEQRFEIRASDAGPRLAAEREEPDATRPLCGRPTACVGRDRELATLDGLLADALGEPAARVALVTAPAGAGKSRLRHEFLRRIAARGERVQVWTGRGDPMNAGSPFALLAQALRGSLGLRGGERALVERVARTVGPADRQRVSEFLGELLGTPFPDEDSVQLRAARRDPVLMGDQVRVAWEDFVAAECEGGGVVLVLEDLHWGDLPTVKLVDAALRNLAERPLLVLAFARPDVHEQFPGLWAERDLQEIRLPGLGRRVAERMVREALGTAVSDTTVARIIDQAAGNAFYLEELIRACAAGGGDELPGSVLAMVQTRLDALAPPVRHVLRAASVFGQVFWEQGVAALLGAEAQDAVPPRLAELVEAELISARTGSRLAGERELVFGQSIIREAAYAALTEQDRAVGHRLAAGWLEQAGETDATMLAEHLRRGGEHARAVACYRRAAEQALGGDDVGSVVALVERAVECGAAGEMLGELRLIQAEARNWRAEHVDALGCAEEALRLLPHGGAAWAEAVHQFLWSAAAAGGHATVPPLVAELEAAAGAAPGLAHLNALIRAASQFVLLGKQERAVELLAAVAPHACAVGEREPTIAAVFAHASAIVASAAGNLPEVLHHFQTAALNWQRAGNRRQATLDGTNVGYCQLELGQHEAAEGTFSETLAIALRFGLQHIVTMSEQNLAMVMLHTGRLEEAGQFARSAIARAGQDARQLGWSCVALSLVLSAQGRQEEAVVEARRALALPISDPGRAQAYAASACALLRVGRVADALVAVRAIEPLLSQLGSLEEGDALTRLVCAEVLHAAGHEAEARATLAAARARLLMRAGHIGGLADRATFLERIPEHARTLALAREWGLPDAT